jgi:hypothetical protein
MKESAALVLASGESISCRGDYSMFADLDADATPMVGPWFVIRRPGRSELLVQIGAGMTLKELEATLARILGQAGARRVIEGFGVREQASGSVEPRLYEPDVGKRGDPEPPTDTSQRERLARDLP